MNSHVLFQYFSMQIFGSASLCIRFSDVGPGRWLLWLLDLRRIEGIVVSPIAHNVRGARRGRSGWRHGVVRICVHFQRVGGGRACGGWSQPTPAGCAWLLAILSLDPKRCSWKWVFTTRWSSTGSSLCWKMACLRFCDKRMLFEAFQGFGGIQGSEGEAVSD